MSTTKYQLIDTDAVPFCTKIKKYILLPILLFLSLYLIYYSYSITNSNDSTIRGSIVEALLFRHWKYNYSIWPVLKSDPKYYVNTTNCFIPYVSPWTADAMKLFNRHENAYCAKEEPVVNVIYLEGIKRYKLYINLTVVRKNYEIKSLKDIRCHYRAVLRTKNNDYRYEYSDWFEFGRSIIVPKQYNSILTKCVSHDEETLNQKDAFFLVQYRPKIDIPKDKPNVLLIGIDSLSRFNFRRNMPKTAAFLDNHQWYEMQGYNKVDDNTFPNLMAVLTGLNASTIYELYEPKYFGGLDECQDYMWNLYRNLSYQTAYGEDTYDISSFVYSTQGFQIQPTDYYLRPFTMAIESFLGVKQEDGLQYCVGRKQYAEYVFDLAIQFAQVYKNEPHFGLFWANSFTHNRHDMASSMDDKMLEYFQLLLEREVFNNSIVIFFSDHGCRFGELMTIPESFLDERLPMFFISLPKSLEIKHPEFVVALQMNKNRLVSHYDLHMTLKHILEIYEPNLKLPSASACPKCQSIFYEMPENRTCTDAGIIEHYCTCHPYDPIEYFDENPLYETITNEIIKSMNQYLNDSHVSNICEKIVLRKIHEVSVAMKPVIANTSTIRLQFDTDPYSAKYRITVQFNIISEQFQFNIEDINRLDSYELYSLCVFGKKEKFFCICTAYVFLQRAITYSVVFFIFFLFVLLVVFMYFYHKKSK